MIYTVTCNPALDYVVKLDALKLGEVNRTREEALYYGGKGINVSAMLGTLGVDSVALGFVAGFTGEAIEKGVKSLGIRTDFVHVRQGFSRINVKLKADEESEVNGRGPSIDEAERRELFDKLDTLRDGDVLVLAGSIPGTLPGDLYEQIMVMLSDRRVEIIVDATRDLLQNVLKHRPFLIKPNHHELGEIYGVTVKDAEEAVVYAHRLQEEGARNVLVSMAGDGAVLLTQEGAVHRAKAPSGTVRNSVGAGDSMVAGFIAGYLKEHDFETPLRLGTAAGSASAFSEGLADSEEVYKLLERM